MSSPMSTKKLTSLEITKVSQYAAKLFDSFDSDEAKRLSSKEAFILGMLHGRQHAFDEIGLFDDEDDDSKIYEFLKDK